MECIFSKKNKCLKTYGLFPPIVDYHKTSSRCIHHRHSPAAPNCIKHFHWLMELFWPIKFDFTIVSIGNNCNVKPYWPESTLGKVVKSNLIGQNHPVNQGNPLYNWVLPFTIWEVGVSGRPVQKEKCEKTA